jgi:uncharacterized protein YkwD
MRATLFLFIAVPLIGAQSYAIGEPPTALPIVEKQETAQPVTIPLLNPLGDLKYVYLPFILKPALCQLSSEETAVAELAINDPNQQRTEMNCNPILAQVARAKAMDLATRNYFDHTDPDGFGPNYYVRQAGYQLPGFYGSANDSNNIESIGAGYTTAESAWNGWLTSSGHRMHVLGEAAFWREQTNYGIGHYYDPNSGYGHYWVFLSAPPEE